MKEWITLFDSRLNTLAMLLDQAEAHFDDGSFLQLRLIEDMHPLSTQIRFTCNSAHDFAQWATGSEPSGIEGELTTVAEAKDCIATTRSAVTRLDPGTTLPTEKRLDFGEMYVDLTGDEYVTEFLIPNFYFHLVTSYDILRANGVAVGKANFMAHLLPRVKQK